MKELLKQDWINILIKPETVMALDDDVFFLLQPG